MKPADTVVRFEVRSLDDAVLVCDLRSQDKARHHAKALVPARIMRVEKDPRGMVRVRRVEEVW
jgi:hypothetical protein